MPSEAKQSAATTGAVADIRTHAKETCEEEMKGFAYTWFVQNDGQVEGMFNIDDDSKCEQRREKSAKFVTKALLDGQPLGLGDVLFLGDIYLCGNRWQG